MKFGAPGASALKTCDSSEKPPATARVGGHDAAAALEPLHARQIPDADLAGDALASPQGRAEDVLFALTWDLKPSTRFFAGHRLLEGGADNDEVCTFSLFHYVVAGAELRF